MSKFGFLLEAETIQFQQKCALTALRIIQSDFSDEVAAIERSNALSMVGDLQDLSDAVYIVADLLDDLNQKLKEAVDEEYKNRKKENALCQD